MRLVDTRTMVGFAVGAAVAVACTAAGASFAREPAARAPAAPVQAASAVAAPAPPLITSACAHKKTGVVTVIGKKHKKCTSSEKAIRFATQVSPTPSILGSDGSLRLKGKVSLTSPNGAYVLVLTDNGLGLKGPGGSVTIDPFAVSTEQSRQTP